LEKEGAAGTLHRESVTFCGAPFLNWLGRIREASLVFQYGVRFMWTSLARAMEAWVGLTRDALIVRSVQLLGTCVVAC
jgi:hypothetical protein